MNEQSLTTLKNLTEENEHILALWYIAKQCDLEVSGAFSDYQDGFANMVAEHMCAGGISNDLDSRVKQLMIAMFKRIKSAFGEDSAETIRMCL